MTDGQLEDWPGDSGGALSAQAYGAALGVHAFGRLPSGAVDSWELQLWPARLDDLAAWLCLPGETPVWRASTDPAAPPETTTWRDLRGATGELLDGRPAAPSRLPDPLLLDPAAALDSAARVAMSVQDGAHAALWTRELALVLAAVRGFVAARTATRPHPALLAELTAPLPLGHAWRLHTSGRPRGRAHPPAKLEMELVGGEHEVRCRWTASATGVWVPRRRSSSAV